MKHILKHKIHRKRISWLQEYCKEQAIFAWYTEYWKAFKKWSSKPLPGALEKNMKEIERLFKTDVRR